MALTVQATEASHFRAGASSLSVLCGAARVWSSLGQTPCVTPLCVDAKGTPLLLAATTHDKSTLFWRHPCTTITQSDKMNVFLCPAAPSSKAAPAAKRAATGNGAKPKPKPAAKKKPARAAKGDKMEWDDDDDEEDAADDSSEEEDDASSDDEVPLGKRRAAAKPKPKGKAKA